ncbi:kinase domain-containing protein [Aspergillus campestris IBT 28561]|uniref:Kinase domain-containing protein n=1 Tax=Aspergillus campestris (strain IBT 28561) TaxID=1392248 RepID=A0A2I1DF63_ASPC2|nr:kinase domain-containing protein [Aspergillus campestris IBT 28561]PKY08501.1 kinase domain-containing protein [Aspergillus campestris IBT 28561]
MSVITSIWWPEDRIKATLCPEFVFSKLPKEILPQLVGPLAWGDGLTSETYLEWILTKAGRLFLTLVDIGIPERIFALVDESLDDSDLPIAAHSVDRLSLSPSGEDSQLEAKFFLAQWRFVVRGIREGEHVKYTENEGVPVELLRTGPTLAREGVEKVVLAGAVPRVYLRTQVTVGGAPHFFDEEEVLDEIRSLKRLSHEHICSIFGSYFVDNTVCILFSGAYERTLMSFLTDAPQPFKRLSKPHRRAVLLNWPHCLANALAWLHAHGQAHGSIRPSNVFVDADSKIFLGQFEALDTLLSPIKVDDVESYQYGAPERWVRSASVHETGPLKSALPSGGRTARRSSSGSTKLNLSFTKQPHQVEPDAESARPESTVSQGTAIRIGFPNSPSRHSFTPSSSSSGSSGGSSRKSIIAPFRRPTICAPSQPTSPGSPRRASSTSRANPVGLPSTHSQTAVVNTWQSHQTHPAASDIFSLGAVFLDIFTHLCKRRISTFVHHRGAKNRTAGRGGGVADCSFHLDRNLAQVTAWITLLDHDATKKQKDPIFAALPPMLEMARSMLSKDPATRPSASQIERHFACVIQQQQPDATIHCTSDLRENGRPHWAARHKQKTGLPPSSISTSRPTSRNSDSPMTPPLTPASVVTLSPETSQFRFTPEDYAYSSGATSEYASSTASGVW